MLTLSRAFALLKGYRSRRQFYSYGGNRLLPNCCVSFYSDAAPSNSTVHSFLGKITRLSYVFLLTTAGF